MAKWLTVCKAEPIGDEETEESTIQMKADLPHFDKLTDAATWYEKQAKLIEQALHDALPGGVYDRLVVAMLQRTASYFVVSYAGFAQCMERDPHG